MKTRFLLLWASLLWPILSFSQVVNTGITDHYDSTEIGKIVLGGFVDTYYGFDFNKPPKSDRQYFVSSPRHNEVSLNLAYLEISYRNEKVRARIVPGFGTYMNYNYSGEKNTLKNIVEANVGLRLSQKYNIWLDVGVLGSPITNETAISKDHYLYTRSMGIEFVPYYISGARITVPLGSKLNLYTYILNGWQEIEDVNDPLSVITQLEYRPNNHWLINWNTYWGDEESERNPLFGMRYFSDLYFIYDPPGKWSFIGCAYGGYQQKHDTLSNTSNYPFWGQYNLSAKYQLNRTSFLSGRFEQFYDPEKIQVQPTTNATGFNMGSFTLGFTHQVASHAFFRIENRYFFAKQRVFQDNHQNALDSDNLLIGNLSVWF